MAGKSAFRPHEAAQHVSRRGSDQLATNGSSWRFQHSSSPRQGARGHGIADRRKAREVVDHLQPGQLAARPYVIVGPDQVGPVQATETHLHPIGQHRLAHRQRAAANGAESALGVGRGAIVRRRSGPSERARREVDEGHEGCAGRAAAHATVAVHDAHRIGACPIAHRAAQTSTGPFHSVPSVITIDRHFARIKALRGRPPLAWRCAPSTLPACPNRPGHRRETAASGAACNTTAGAHRR